MLKFGGGVAKQSGSYSFAFILRARFDKILKAAAEFPSGFFVMIALKEPLEHFQQKWTPVLRRKMRKNK